jgi:hypothetical protein
MFHQPALFDVYPKIQDLPRVKPANNLAAKILAADLEALHWTDKVRVSSL